MSPSFGNNGIRRAQSEGNLDSLISSINGSSDDEFSFFNAPKKHSSSRLHGSMLETIPSRSKSDGEESSDDEGLCEFSGFDIENKVLSLNKQMGYGNLAIKDDIGESGSQMYLAKGLGVDAGFGSGGGGRNLSHVGRGDGGGGGDNNHDTEEYYRKMVVENPGNALFLGNYARYLYQVSLAKFR